MTSISKIALNNTEYNLEDTSARSSLDNLATVATSGSYNDLTNKPDLSGYQTTTNLVTSVSSSSTDSQYPSAKCVYDIVGDIESAINIIRGVL